MAILRAGPWGNLSSPHEDEADPNESPYSPVNCGKNNWPNQPWGAVATAEDIDIEPFPHSSVVGFNETVTAQTDLGGITFTFCYQATAAFNIEFNWEILTPQSEGLPGLGWNYNTIEGNADSDFETPNNVGTKTIQLPASTFGEFSCFVDIGSPDIEDIEASLS